MVSASTWQVHNKYQVLLTTTRRRIIPFFLLRMNNIKTDCLYMKPNCITQEPSDPVTAIYLSALVFLSIEDDNDGNCFTSQSFYENQMPHNKGLLYVNNNNTSNNYNQYNHNYCYCYSLTILAFFHTQLSLNSLV